MYISFLLITSSFYSLLQFRYLVIFILCIRDEFVFFGFYFFFIHYFVVILFTFVYRMFFILCIRGEFRHFCFDSFFTVINSFITPCAFYLCTSLLSYLTFFTFAASSDCVMATITQQLFYHNAVYFSPGCKSNGATDSIYYIEYGKSAACTCLEEHKEKVEWRSERRGGKEFAPSVSVVIKRTLEIPRR